MAEKAKEALEAPAEVAFRQDFVHKRCGGTYVATSKAEIVPDDGECPVCSRVLKIHILTGQKVASPGTPLAAEIGMVFTTGKVGPVEDGTVATATPTIILASDI